MFSLRCLRGQATAACTAARCASARSLTGASNNTSTSTAARNIDGISLHEYRQRRQTLADRLPPNSCAIVPGAPLKIMSNDIPFRFRQDSSLRYLCGFHEHDAVLVLQSDGQRQVGGFVRAYQLGVTVAGMAVCTRDVQRCC